ncbi:MAG: hypothetical protein V1804_04690 [Patescibacteria group bacterium]
MNKKILLTGVLGLAVLGMIMFFSVKKNNNLGNVASRSNADIILFYGDGCSHCANVDKFIAENNVKEKIKFDELEIFKNKENSSMMEEKAKACGINLNELGVPFLWDKGQCLSGDADIINFFKSQIGEQQ